MARLLNHVQGRLAIKHVCHTSVPGLARFNVEPSRVKSFGVFAEAAFQNEARFSRLSNLYNVFTPNVAGLLPKKVPFSFSLRYLNYIAKQHPWKVGMSIGITKAVLADIFAQKVVEKRESLDYRRTGLFFAFGVIYSGGVLTSVYNFVYPAIFVSKLKSVNAIGATIVDNALNTPFVLLPTLCILKECLMKGKSLAAAWDKYTSEFVESVLMCWKIWVPAHIITFGLVPVHLRMPYVSCISFIYYTAISLQQTMFDNRRKNEALSKQLNVQSQ